MASLISSIASSRVFPAFGQEMTPNESLSGAKFDIDWDEFNLPSRDAVIIPFDDIHETTWQVNLENKLLMGNPEGVAVVRLYDANIEDKFIEIGMGGIPDRNFVFHVMNFLDLDKKLFNKWFIKVNDYFGNFRS